MYCKYDENTKKCTEVGTGTNTKFYKSIGMVDMEVEQAYDGSYYLKGYAPTKPLYELKADKLNELASITSKYDNQLVNTDMIINSSLGFTVNADLRSQNNLRGLIEVGIEPVDYVLADNTSVSLSIDQLKILLNDCMLNMQYLYQQKWDYRAKIDDAKTLDELNAIDLQFEMKNFSAS